MRADETEVGPAACCVLFSAAFLLTASRVMLGTAADAESLLPRLAGYHSGAPWGIKIRLYSHVRLFSRLLLH